MKRMLFTLLAALQLFGGAAAPETLRDDAIDIKAPSAVLMEKQSGEVIYEKNAHERMAPASVTKVMTMLLIVEAIENGDISLDDTVIASERAASFGGSCVFLEEGEKMSVHEMLKCISVVSANDCAVAMAEHLCGSEQSFVERMNARAEELGMKNTHFTNCTGLFDDREHYTSAYDIALMSRELIRHDLIKDYTTIWMDSIRNGEFGLSNTNKLVYYYEGCTGLKTGFTSLAMYCLSATAMRDGVEYIAVIMHAESVDSRNNDAKALLNYAFANYTVSPAAGVRPAPGLRRAGQGRLRSAGVHGSRSGAHFKAGLGQYRIYAAASRFRGGARQKGRQPRQHERSDKRAGSVQRTSRSLSRRAEDGAFGHFPQSRRQSFRSELTIFSPFPVFLH